ncbi:patatin-like phospholipase family protein [Hydrogenophaga sp.]|uniref:patatin-like phospholipase family protein n=1 Tax=Hydrogenophaga sp. TaxID=1904254 RepID=UPI0025B88615|nr:patatin-like phospholipase family protein [Hydrogenophaga sp.]MBT9465609.1 patatin-like phospholipase family protein [Hydrogenophaga sp.]
MKPLKFRQRTRALLVCAVVLLLSACSTARPWINQPIAAASPVPTSTPIVVPVVDAHEPAPTIVAAVTLSGGGARAAAFGLGVLEELKATQFKLDGRPTTMLDEVGLVSGVSGGSILAGYYAAFGDDVFTSFERDFLLMNFQSNLIHDLLLTPRTAYELSSPWYGRSNVLARQLDTVFQGKTFGDLRAQSSRRRLLVTATDLTTGAPFEFTPEQFALICSDLDSVPLSFAVAASSSVPLLLSPMTVKNYAGSCPPPAPLNAGQQADANLSARVLQLIAGSYSNAEERPYIHLVDGGLVDNLGVRSLLDRTVAAGSLSATFGGLPPGSVRRIVLVSVNSERDTTDRIDMSDRVPSTSQVLDSLVFGAGARVTTETTMMMGDVTRRLSEELQVARNQPGGPFAPDAEIHVINLRLQDLQDPGLRHAVLRVPTALTILPGQVRELRAAGRAALRESPAFQHLQRSLDGATPAR